MADKGYDTNAVLQTLQLLGTEAVSPPKRGRKKPQAYDANLYADRNKIERCVGRLKQARAVATRYGKTGVSFLAALHVAAVLDWLR